MAERVRQPERARALNYNHRMPVVSITRLRVRKWRFMPGFAVYAVRSRSQALKAEGNLGIRLMRAPGNVFWTATAWESEDAVKRFMLAQPHGEAMKRLMDWCDEASVAHWTVDDAALPSWSEADRRMRTQGRASKVYHPSPHHADLSYAEPRTSGAVPIRKA